MGIHKARLSHAIIGLGLLACAICPFVEIALHSPDCIFVNGYDTESTIALVLLLVELVFAVAKLLALLPSQVFAKAAQIQSRPSIFLSAASTAIVVDLSPPLSLRI